MNSHSRSARIIVPLLCGVALLLLAAPARAQIALVDNELTTASPVTTSMTSLLLNTNLTVSASANTLVIEVTFRNFDTTFTEAPATLGWTNATVSTNLTLAVQITDKNSHGRGSAIYYLYNPPAGTGFNIQGKLSGMNGAGGTSSSSGDMVAYTLSGVDTTAAPLTNSASSTSGASLSFNVGGVTANSWAAVGGVIANSATAITSITATNSGAATGTPTLTTATGGFSSTTTTSMGYISSIIFGGSETFTMMVISGQADSALTAAVFKPSNLNFLAIGQQPQTATIASGANATYTVSANGNPAITSYQWYQISGGATNSISGATTSSYINIAPTAGGTNYFVVIGNGSTTVTSSVAGLNIYVSGIWNTSSGSWNTSGSWVGSAIANGVSATAWFTNGLGGTVTLDNAAGFTVGTGIFGTNGATTAEPSWAVNSGSPAGTLTMALDPSVPTSVVSGGSAPTVTEVPMITVYSNTPVTINAPLAGNQGLFVNGGGTLVLAGGNTNNTYSGNTVIGSTNSDVTSLQIGTGGTSGAIDFSNTIYLSGYGQLIFNRSDTITMTSSINDQAGKAPNVIVNSGTVIWAPQTIVSPYDGAIVNSGGTLVLDCPVGIYAIANTAGTVNITNGTPNTPVIGQNSGGTSVGINSGGVLKLAGPGGNGVNIQANNGVLDSGVFDLGGDAVQVGFIAGAGIVTNSGATVSILNLSGSQANAAYPWSGTIADGATAQTAVTLSGGTTVFTGPNTYTGNTLLSGTLILSNSASLASANIYVSGANLIFANTPTITNPHATLYVGSGRTLNLTEHDWQFHFECRPDPGCDQHGPSQRGCQYRNCRRWLNPCSGWLWNCGHDDHEYQPDLEWQHQRVRSRNGSNRRRRGQ